MKNHFKNLWRYSFGYESVVVGIIYAKSHEECVQKVMEAYKRGPAGLVVRPIGARDNTFCEDVKEIIHL